MQTQTTFIIQVWDVNDCLLVVETTCVAAKIQETINYFCGVFNKHLATQEYRINVYMQQNN
jgi:hypothetical protein